VRATADAAGKQKMSRLHMRDQQCQKRVQRPYAAGI
jgi:hypothetical protein